MERLPAAAQGVPPLAVATTSLTRRGASRLHVPAILCGCTSCTSALGRGATHGAVARVCCGRQATGVTPTVHKVRFSSERGRCVTHWRSDGTTAPEAAAPGARARAVGVFYGGITRGGRLKVWQGRERSSPGHDAPVEHAWVLPQGPLGLPARARITPERTHLNTSELENTHLPKIVLAAAHLHRHAKHHDRDHDVWRDPKACPKVTGPKTLSSAQARPPPASD